MLVTAGVEGYWSYESSVTYNCSTGYNLTFDLPLICLSNGSWNGTPPECELVTCLPPNVPDNGFYEPGNKTYFYRDKVEFTCLLGFDRIGQNSSYCNATGQWSVISPTCQIRDCGQLTNPINGTMMQPDGSTFGETAYYNCSEGYTLNGTDTRTCNASGNWTLEAPTCDIIRKLNIDYID